MNYAMAYALVGIGTAFVLLLITLFVKYKNIYDDMIVVLNKNKFILADMYFIGMGFIELFHINLRSNIGRKKEKKIAEIYGSKYAAFYHYCIIGGQITYILTLIPIGCFIGAMTRDVLYAALAMGATIAIVAYLDSEVNKAVDKRRDEIMIEYPEVLSKITLLVNAGMIVREAWIQVAFTGETALYKEMQTTSEEMNNGVSDADALYNFSQRCAIKQIRKFASVLSQNLQKGGSELANSLKYMNVESWEEKKYEAKRKGELAGQKLMLPLTIMFIGILFMVMVPIFNNMF